MSMIGSKVDASVDARPRRDRRCFHPAAAGPLRPGVGKLFACFAFCQNFRGIEE